MQSYAVPTQHTTTSGIIAQLSGQTLVRVASKPTRLARVQAVREYFQFTKDFIVVIARDYKGYGKFYHNLPCRDRYHVHAKVNGIAADAKADFIISPSRGDVTVMITLLSQCQVNLSETGALLEEPVSIFELYEVYSHLISINRQVNQAYPIIGKIQATMGLYEKVIVPQRNAAGDWGVETDKYRPRQLRQAQGCEAALPVICDGTLPVVNAAAVRREAMRKTLAGTWPDRPRAIRRGARGQGRARRVTITFGAGSSPSVLRTPQANGRWASASF
jgi:hypothetical protein